MSPADAWYREKTLLLNRGSLSLQDLTFPKHAVHEAEGYMLGGESGSSQRRSTGSSRQALQVTTLQFEVSFTIITVRVFRLILLTTHTPTTTQLTSPPTAVLLVNTRAVTSERTFRIGRRA